MLKIREMKRIFLLSVSILLSGILLSQVGIGTNAPNSSAILDLTATNKALLLTRVALTGTNDVTTIPNPVAGLIVLNTANASTGTTTAVKANQIYGFDGTQWALLINEELLSEQLGEIQIPQLAGYAYYRDAQSFAELTGEINEIIFPSGTRTEELFSGSILERVSGSNSRFRVLKGGKYVFTGFLNWLMSGVGAGDPSFWTAGVQKSSDSGSTWLNITGIRCPYIAEYRGLTVPCNYSGVGTLAVGDILRFVGVKKNGSVPISVTTAGSTGLGVPFSAGFNITVYTQ